MLQLGGPLDAGFEDPLGLLRDCHRRIERFLATLVKVGELPADGPLSPVEAEALDTALRYFAGMATKHTADEEESLFPRLRQVLATASDAAASELLATMQALEADHRAADAAHAKVARLGQRWLSAGSLPSPDRQRFAALLEQLSAVYAAHIAIEDHQLFVAAGQRLDGDTLAAVGAEMAARRGHQTCSQRKAARGPA
ncbi:MAG: hemerythrin domain-containing protein [Fimbriimonadaceae bacterium]|nr:hemerythrin domain-containing protein [Fimbriimonadaceae bacterium]